MSAIPDKIGRYRIETVLGRGAMGVIYRAHDPEIDRPVAIKLIRAEAPARAHDVRHLTSGGRPLPVVSMGSWNAWKELARYVGPIARVLLKPMAADLWQQIECEGDRRAFLSGRRTEPEPANTRCPLVLVSRSALVREVTGRAVWVRPVCRLLLTDYLQSLLAWRSLRTAHDGLHIRRAVS